MKNNFVELPDPTKFLSVWDQPSDSFVMREHNGVKYALPANYIGTEKEAEYIRYIDAQKRFWTPNLNEFRDIDFILSAYQMATGSPITIPLSGGDIEQFLELKKMETFEIVTEGNGEPPYRYELKRLNINIPIYGVKLIFKRKKNKVEIMEVKDFIRFFIQYIPKRADNSPGVKLYPNQTAITANKHLMIPLDIKNSITGPAVSQEIEAILQDENKLSDARKYGIPLGNGSSITLKHADTNERAREILKAFINPRYIAYYHACYKLALKTATKRDVRGEELFEVEISYMEVLEYLGYSRPKNYYEDFRTFLNFWECIELNTKIGKSSFRTVRMLYDMISESTGSGSKQKKIISVIDLPGNPELRIIGALIPDEILRLAKDAPERVEFYSCLLISFISNKPDKRTLVFKYSEIREFYKIGKTEDTRQYKAQVKKALDQFKELKALENWKMNEKGDYIITFPDWHLPDNRVFKELK